MPFIQDIIKKPLNKGFSSVVFKWFGCAMLTPIKKGLELFIF